MKKITSIIVLFTLTFISKSSIGQVEFMHSFGLATHLTIGNDNINKNILAIMYAPKLNVLQVNDEATISVGTRLGFGFDGSTSSAFLPMYEVPLLIDYNLNALSSKESYEESGFFVGGGLNYNSMTYLGVDQNTNGLIKVPINTFGWTVNGGMTFNKEKKKFAIRAAYTNGINNTSKIVSLAVLYYPIFN